MFHVGFPVKQPPTKLHKKVMLSAERPNMGVCRNGVSTLKMVGVEHFVWPIG